jgi:hypothetical protein
LNRALVAPVTMVVLVACGGASAPPAKGADESPKPAAMAKAQTPAEIAARATPAVVSIRTAHSLGTGFVVSSDGWIATNVHVIVGGPKVVVTLADKRELPVVEVIAASPDRDLAIVRVEAKGLPALKLGDSDALRPGDPVVAIGHPLGLEDTVSNGLVSAVRSVGEGPGEMKVLQISAPIAPGSSGGPIFNEHGEVVGVATAILAGGQNLGFGVPVRYLAQMIAQPAPMPIAEFAALVAQVQQAVGAASKIERHVPHHPTSMLAGCTVDMQKLIVRTLGEAIEVGAPLYNQGNFAACYHVYDGATSDLERKLGAACKGPKQALTDGQKRAASLPTPGAQAWAMRDAFDGLLDVIARKQEGRD